MLEGDNAGPLTAAPSVRLFHGLDQAPGINDVTGGHRSHFHAQHGRPTRDTDDCFIGPHTEYRDDGGRVIHHTYRRAGWHEVQPWWAQRDGLRNRVGMRQVPLAQFLHAFLDAGLIIDQVTEPELLHPVPFILQLRLRRPC